MGKIIRNGIEYSGTYDDATSVNYNNSVSGLNANTVQEGIDELTKGSKGAFPVDNLLSTATDIPLSANQGRVLDEKISEVNDNLERFPIINRGTVSQTVSSGSSVAVQVEFDTPFRDTSYNVAVGYHYDQGFNTIFHGVRNKTINGFTFTFGNSDATSSKPFEVTLDYIAIGN